MPKLNPDLLAAIAARDIKAFNELLQQKNIQLNGKTQGLGLLHLLIQYHKEEVDPKNKATLLAMFDLLLQRKDLNVDINIKDSIGRTPLHHAIWHKQFAMAKRLIQVNAKVNAQDNNGFTALHYACQTKEKRFLQMLIEETTCDPKLVCNVTINKYVNFLTPLQFACYKNKKEYVEELIPIDDILHPRNHILLHFAAKNGNANLVQNFLKQGVPVSEHLTLTPIIYTIARYKDSNYKACFDLLFTHEINFTANGSILFQRLLAHKFNIALLSSANQRELFNSKDGHGNTPLHLIIANNQPQYFSLLLQESPLDLPNVDGETPFFLAVKSGHTNLVDQFIEKYKKQNQPPLLPKTIPSFLYAAVMFSHSHLIPSLIKLGFNSLHQTDENGNTPLHLAVKNKDKNSVKELLISIKYFPNILSLTNSQKKTAHEIADDEIKALFNQPEKPKTTVTECVAAPKFIPTNQETTISKNSATLWNGSKNGFNIKHWSTILKKYQPEDSWKPGQTQFTLIKIPSSDSRIYLSSLPKAVKVIRNFYLRKIATIPQKNISEDNGIYLSGSLVEEIITEGVKATDIDLVIVGNELTLEDFENWSKQENYQSIKHSNKEKNIFSLQIFMPDTDSGKILSVDITFIKDNLPQNLFGRDYTKGAVTLHIAWPTSKINNNVLSVVGVWEWLQDLIKNNIRCLDIPENSFKTDLSRKLRLVYLLAKSKNAKATIDDSTLKALTATSHLGENESFYKLFNYLVKLISLDLALQITTLAKFNLLEQIVINKSRVYEILISKITFSHTVDGNFEPIKKQLIALLANNITLKEWSDADKKLFLRIANLALANEKKSVTDPDRENYLKLFACLLMLGIDMLAIMNLKPSPLPASPNFSSKLRS